MSDADWPAPEPTAPREPAERSAALPRVEDLPIAEQGYDREKVREAFDAFYRHAAQLDATLRTLESVEVFQRTAAELRAELRTIRGTGWTVQSWQGGSYATRPRASEWTLPPSFPRVAGEAIFLIVVGVAVGVAGWSRLAIVAVMGAALAVVWMIEWVAARERAIPRAAAPAAVPVLDEEPAELPAAEAVATPAEEGPEALTILDEPPVRVEDEAAPPEPEVPDEPVQPELPEEPVVEDTAEELVEPVEIASVFEPRAVAAPEPEPEPEPEPLPEPEPEEQEPVVSEAPPAVAEELEPTPEVDEDVPVAGIVEVEELPQERRRFRLFKRPSPEPAAEEVDEVTDEAVAHVDPWEQEPSLPEEPDASEPIGDEEPFEEPEPEEPFVTPAPEEPFVEPETPSPFEQPEAPPFWEPPQGEADGSEEEVREELPVDALAEQASAALERSRARRRAPRRARRR